jgi:hypothetical protein
MNSNENQPANPEPDQPYISPWDHIPRDPTLKQLLRAAWEYSDMAARQLCLNYAAPAIQPGESASPPDSPVTDTEQLKEAIKAFQIWAKLEAEHQHIPAPPSGNIWSSAWQECFIQFLFPNLNPTEREQLRRLAETVTNIRFCEAHAGHAAIAGDDKKKRRGIQEGREDRAEWAKQRAALASLETKLTALQLQILEIQMFHPDAQLDDDGEPISDE